MRRTIVFLLLALCSPAAAAEAQTGKAVVIGAGAALAPGVKSTAVSYDATKVDAREVQPLGRSAVAHVAGAAPAAPPAPVAISAHNCVPRLDARGISLSFEFSEGAADCVSFVSPAPVRPRDPKPRRPNARPDPEQLARRAFDRVISLSPRPSISVAPARIGLTGLDSFFWVGNDLRPVTATAGVRGLTVTAEARPVRYLWDFGDGATLDTHRPGRPWTRERPGDTSHLYETKGRYTPSVEVVWAARWRVNGGAWRALGYFSNTGSLEYPVREMVAVLVRRH